MISRIYGDLANAYGNLVQRVLSLINKNCDAKVPQPADFSDADRALLSAACSLLPICRAEIEQLAIHKMLEAIWQIIYEANKYVDEQAPWALKKTDPARMNTVLYVLAEVIRQVSILTQPVMPTASAEILDQLAVPDYERNFAALAVPLAVGVKLPAPQGVFPRFVEPKTAASA